MLVRVRLCAGSKTPAEGGALAQAAAAPVPPARGSHRVRDAIDQALLDIEQGGRCNVRKLRRLRLQRQQSSKRRRSRAGRTLERRRRCGEDRGASTRAWRPESHLILQVQCCRCYACNAAALVLARSGLNRHMLDDPASITSPFHCDEHHLVHQLVARQHDHRKCWQHSLQRAHELSRRVRLSSYAADLCRRQIA